MLRQMMCLCKALQLEQLSTVTVTPTYLGLREVSTQQWPRQYLHGIPGEANLSKLSFSW